MKRKRNNKRTQNKKPIMSGNSPDQKQQNTNAHIQADKDIINDAELTAHNKNDDLDEGETAKLGENTDLV